MSQMLNRKISLRSHKGFSLMEFSVSSVLGLTMLMTVMSVDVFTKRNLVANTALVDTQSSSRIAMDWLAKDIRQAVQIEQQWPLSGTPTYTTSGTQIVLKLQALTGTFPNETVSGVNNDYIVYYRDPSATNTLKRKILQSYTTGRPVNEVKTITTFLDSTNNLIFTSGGSAIGGSGVVNLKSVDVRIDTRKKTFKKDVSNDAYMTETLKSKIQLRNHS